ncbi:methylmalonyl-CoA mutase cobalamin-binding domain/chain [Micromonospora luteifusca]|nr:methylmalonyl-CoA mutase cobalamin-binding domain/chain [Micromonospora luteifusca]
MTGPAESSGLTAGGAGSSGKDSPGCLLVAPRTDRHEDPFPGPDFLRSLGRVTVRSGEGREAGERCALMSSRIRVVVAKPGLDGHDRGAKVVARALRDAGMEVVYTGLHQTPEQIVETAIQEDADAVGLSVLSGAHMTLFRRVLELLGERDARDIVVFGGGIIPNGDIPELEKLGVAKIFTPGATTQAIVEWVRQNVAQPVS